MVPIEQGLVRWAVDSETTVQIGLGTLEKLLAFFSDLCIMKVGVFENGPVTQRESAALARPKRQFDSGQVHIRM